MLVQPCVNEIGSGVVQRDVRDLAVAIRIEDIGLAQAVRLVQGARKNGLALRARVSFGLVGINAVEAEFGAGAPAFDVRNETDQRVFVKGMVRVDHPFHLAKFEDGKISISIDCFRAEDMSCKRYRGRNIRDQQIDVKAGERRAIFRGRPSMDRRCVSWPF